ncbi:MAG: DUF488 domain-containing protein [Gemmatimonadaceae bacterium]
MTLTIWTIGHSTRTAGDFRGVLDAHAIELVADVRRFPGSRRLPQFGASVLEADLPADGILYHWLPALGGRRSPQPGSVNDGWRHRAFRGYADHLQTEEFAEGLVELLTLSYGLRTAIMCAELLWWRCHRRLIADVLTTLGVQVIHVRDAAVSEPHRLTPPGHLVHGELSYRAMQ